MREDEFLLRQQWAKRTKTWLTFEDVSAAVAETGYAISNYASGVRSGRGSLARVAFAVAHMPPVLENLLARFDADDEDLAEFRENERRYLGYLRTTTRGEPNGPWRRMIGSYVARQRIRLVVGR